MWANTKGCKDEQYFQSVNTRRREQEIPIPKISMRSTSLMCNVFNAWSTEFQSLLGSYGREMNIKKKRRRERGTKYCVPMCRKAINRVNAYSKYTTSESCVSINKQFQDRRKNSLSVNSWCQCEQKADVTTRDRIVSLWLQGLEIFEH